MPDIMPATIIIGGTVTKAQAEKIVSICEETSDFVYYYDAVGRSKKLRDLKDAVSPKRGVVVLLDDEASWGEFGALEEYLVEERIPFQRTTLSEDLQYRVTFDPAQGIEEPYKEAILNGQVVVGRDEVLRAYLQLLENNEHAASFTLQRVLGKTVEALHPFNIANITLQKHPVT